MRISIVSGYFNPLHVGHLQMMQEARDAGDQLIVIVNNDEQQILKKGKVILSADDRLRIVQALSVTGMAFVALDRDATVRESLAYIRQLHPNDHLVFCNGGDRSQPDAVAEYGVCQQLDIELEFGVGGTEKTDSSTRINAALGVDS